jgi:hypothetical protein
MFVTITINLMDKVDKLINIIRQLHEDGMSAGANIVGNGEKSLGFNIQTGTPPVNKRPPILARGRMQGARTRWKKLQP